MTKPIKCPYKVGNPPCNCKTPAECVRGKSWQSGGYSDRKSLFTRRHYEVLAGLLCQLAAVPYPDRARLPCIPKRESKAEYHERIVTALCALLQEDNPRFRPEAFRAAVNRKE